MGFSLLTALLFAWSVTCARQSTRHHGADLANLGRILVAFAVLTPTQAPPAAWTCDAATFGDAVCDCGCGAQDSDCSSLNFSVCVRSGCDSDEAPWEHTNYSCMAAVCGDGWRSDNEACDDGNRLASGGCSADCATVTDGFACGDAFRGCQPVGEGEGEGDDAVDEAGDDDAGTGEPSGGGCTAALPGGSSLLLVAGLVVLSRRRVGPAR